MRRPAGWTDFGRAALAVSLAVFVSCGQDGESRVSSAVASAQEQTLAPGAQFKGSSPVQRENLGFTAGWELESQQDWSE